jgi:hypothetical protein
LTAAFELRIFGHKKFQKKSTSLSIHESNTGTDTAEVPKSLDGQAKKISEGVGLIFNSKGPRAFLTS